MKVEIEYCVVWNYFSQAARLADSLQSELGIESELVKGSGGAFEVKCDNKLIFSKLQTGRFPTEAEIKEKIRQLIWLTKKGRWDFWISV